MVIPVGNSHFMGAGDFLSKTDATSAVDASIPFQLKEGSDIAQAVHSFLMIDYRSKDVNRPLAGYVTWWAICTNRCIVLLQMIKAETR